MSFQGVRLRKMEKYGVFVLPKSCCCLLALELEIAEADPR